jgi:L-threonylcarbamoyladenylate synthase
MQQQQQLEQALQVLRNGGLIVYPTEGVYGLGCDAANESAVQRLLALKQRPESMGLISIIADLQQVEAWLDTAYRDQWPKATETWPAPHTWLFPCDTAAPAWLTGEHHSRLALRVPDHPFCLQMCSAFGAPIVSTSANVSGAPAARRFAELDQRILAAVDVIIQQPCGQQDKPSTITDLLTEQNVRS